MRSFTIASLPGDGPGPLFLAGVEKALRILEGKFRSSPEAFSLDFQPRRLGLEELAASGKTLAPETIAAIKAADAALLGMIDHKAEHADSAIGPMRRELMLYADVRPVKAMKGVWAISPDLDMVCIRESTEDFLADRNMYRGGGEVMPTADTVVSMRVITRAACRRIGVFAFEYARKNGRKKVTVVHKANVLKMGCGMFLDTIREVGRDYPEVQLDDDFVDNVAHKMIASPGSYDVLVMTNLMGDILSDEASALVSGMTGSANVGDDAAVFFPVSHLVDSATCRPEDMNPVPVFLCAELMLRHLGLAGPAGVFAEKIAEAAAEMVAGGTAGAAGRFVDSLCSKLA